MLSAQAMALWAWVCLWSLHLKTRELNQLTEAQSTPHYQTLTSCAGSASWHTGCCGSFIVPGTQVPSIFLLCHAQHTGVSLAVSSPTITSTHQLVRRGKVPERLHPFLQRHDQKVMHNRHSYLSGQNAVTWSHPTGRDCATQWSWTSAACVRSRYLRTTSRLLPQHQKPFPVLKINISNEWKFHVYCLPTSGGKSDNIGLLQISVWRWWWQRRLEERPLEQHFKRPLEQHFKTQESTVMESIFYVKNGKQIRNLIFLLYT